MAQIKHIATGAIYAVSVNPVFQGGIWECGDQRFTDLSGTEYEVLKGLQATINFSYPSAAAKTTDIVVDVVVVDLAANNTLLPVNATYYVPLYDVSNPGNEVMVQMLVVPIIDGAGQASFIVNTPGIYSIKPAMIRPLPTAQFSVMPDICVY